MNAKTQRSQGAEEKQSGLRSSCILFAALPLRAFALKYVGFSNNLLGGAVRAWLDWLFLFAWTAFIWFLSSRPDVPSAGNDLLDTILRQGGHFMLHFILFLAAWRAGVGSFGRQRGMIFALVYALANACLDELYQTTVPGRNANLEDVLTNGAGVLLGFVVVVGSQRRPRPVAPR